MDALTRRYAMNQSVRPSADASADTFRRRGNNYLRSIPQGSSSKEEFHMAYADSRSPGKSNVSYMVRLAVLVAILFLLEVTGLGLIKTPGLEFTIMQVPVIIGAIVMGPAAGAILGGVFGLIS
ncbi:MAG: ECF transporter S component, partial [Clostridia bacterium]|nr:ECF transporter S component [Clostridia bacterium]